jgi:hypothetical protein
MTKNWTAEGWAEEMLAKILLEVSNETKSAYEGPTLKVIRKESAR